MNKKQFIKSYIASVLAGIIFIISAVSMSPLKVDAYINVGNQGAGSPAPSVYNVGPDSYINFLTLRHNHVTAGTELSNKQIQSNKTVSGYSSSSACYQTLNKHSHEGNTTSAGACYDPVYHQHTSACHTIVYHKHTDSCKFYQNIWGIARLTSSSTMLASRITWDSANSTSICPVCGQGNNAGYGGRAYKATVKNGSTNVDMEFYLHNTNGNSDFYIWRNNQTGQYYFGQTFQCSKKAPGTGTYWNGSTYICGKNTSTVESDTITCGKTAGSTIDSYKLKTTDPYYTGNVYTCDCPFSTGNGNSIYGRGSIAFYSNNKLSFNFSPENAMLSDVTRSFTATITDPDGTVHNYAQSNPEYLQQEYQCTDIGTHTFVLSATCSIRGIVTDNDSLTVNFTPVAQDTAVNYYNGDTLLDTKTFQKGTEDNIVSVPTKTGYRFEGYYTNLNDENTLVYSSTGVKVMEKFCPLNGGTVNLYAKFVPETFTVSYFIENSIEEAVNNTQKDFTYDQTTGLNITAQKEYDGWQTDGFYYGDAKLFNNDGSFVRDKWDIAENIDVAPHYTPNTYTLYYNNNKEDSVTTNSIEINYNDNYCLPATAISGRTEYEGYTFNGWYDGDTLIFDAEGNNTDSGKWRYLSDINATATYTANPYTVNYNTNETDAPSKTIDVTYDLAYSIPSEDVASVPSIPGYTFDGWFDSNNNKIFNKNGTSVADVYKFDHNITVYATYHKNNYIVHYNTSQIPDEYLDRTQTVTFDMEYLDIDEAPYKPGYVFMGHKLEGAMSFIWDGYGSKTHAIWDFLCGEDGSEVNAVKVYEPKTFTIKIGDDADNDNAIDSVEDTQNATFDNTFFDLSVPSARNGYTFDGYYCPELDTWVARYNSNNNTLTKTSNTWVWDDNIDWNDGTHSDLTLIKKWHANKYFVCYNDTTELNPTFTNSIVKFLNAGADINHILMLYNRNGEENLVVLSENGSAHASMVCLDENDKPAGVAIAGNPSAYYYFSTQLWGGDWWNNQNFYVYLDKQAPYPNTFFYPLICYNAAYLPLTTYMGEIRSAGNTHTDYGVNGMQIDIPEDKILQYNIAIFNQAYPYIGIQPHKYGYTSLGYYFKDANNEEQQIYNTNGEKTSDV